MNLRVITFDLDNTLWDVEPALVRAEDAQNRWLREHRPRTLEGRSDEELLAFKKSLWRDRRDIAHDVSAMRRLLLRELQLRAGYAPAAADAGTEAAFEAFLDERQRVDLYPGALETLERLARDYCLGALTNGNADIYKTAAGPYFDFAFRAEDVGASKPAPDMFHAALAHADAQAHEVLHVGDSPDHDVRGALAVGIRAAWINPSEQPWAGDGTPHVTLAHIRELPAALANLRD